MVDPSGASRAPWVNAPDHELDRLLASHPDAPRPLLDLATAANPWPYPVAVPQATRARPPLGADTEAARAAAAAYLAVDDPACIVLVPGADAAIADLPHLLAPTRATVLSPGYAAYAPAWRAAGHTVAELTGPEAAESDAPVLVVTNPGDREGTVLQPETLRELARACRARGGLLVVDEAFADLAPEISIAAEAPALGAVVLRTLSKGFGLPGMRAGAVVAPAELAAGLAGRAGIAGLAGPALVAMVQAYGDPTWMAEMRGHLDAAARELDAALSGIGVTVAGGTALYRLIDTPMAVHVQATLARHGIAARTFAGDAHRLRVGIPGDETARARLMTALRTAFGV